MKWAYNLQQKFKIALLLSVVFISLFIKNMIDKHNITTLGETFSSVYEDRLLAESYIYKFSAHIYQKKILINECASNADIAQYKSMLKFHDNAIEKLIQDFGHTKLTQEEALVFSKFKKTLQENRRLEDTHLYQVDYETHIKEVRSILNKSFLATSNQLNELSNIQLLEGEKLNQTSKKIVVGSATENTFELSLLIIVGVLVHVLIFTSNASLPKKPQNSSLN